MTAVGAVQPHLHAACMQTFFLGLDKNTKNILTWKKFEGFFFSRVGALSLCEALYHSVSYQVHTVMRSEAGPVPDRHTWPQKKIHDSSRLSSNVFREPLATLWAFELMKLWCPQLLAVWFVNLCLQV